MAVAFVFEFAAAFFVIWTYFVAAAAAAADDDDDDDSFDVDSPGNSSTALGLWGMRGSAIGIGVDTEWLEESRQDVVGLFAMIMEARDALLYIFSIVNLRNRNSIQI